MDEIKKNIEDLKKRAELLRRTHEIPASELFTDSFMQRHTRFISFGVMVGKSGFKVETPEDFMEISDTKRDVFIQLKTEFSNWQEMITKAREEWMAEKLKG